MGNGDVMKRCQRTEWGHDISEETILDAGMEVTVEG